MKKNKKYFGFLSFLLIIFVIISPTYGKYFYNDVGVAGFFTFSPLIPTGVFVVDNDDFIGDNGETLEEAQSDSKWGAGDSVEDKSESELENNFGINSLEKVLFSVNNATNKKLLVKFYVELYFKSNIGTNMGLTVKRTTFSIQITNITKSNQSISGDYNYTTSDQNEKGDIFSKTISPADTNIFPDVTTQTVEELFVLNPSDYMEYNVKITGDGDFLSSIGDWLSTNCYYSFHMIVSEYNPV